MQSGLASVTPVSSRVVRTGLLFALLLLILPGPTPVVTQDTGIRPDQMARVIARLVDSETGAPIAQAFATLTSLDRRALSDSTGTIVFMDIPPGEHELLVRHIAYGEQTLTLDIESMTSTVLAVELTPVAIAVEPLEVQIEHRPRYLEDEGFYDRRAVGYGTFFDPQFVERWGVGGWAQGKRFINLLFDFAPRFHPSVIGCLGPGPVVYIDGFRRGQWRSPSGSAEALLETMSTWDIGAVELYPSPNGTPDFAFTPDATCGVIVVWTNRWRGRERRLGGGDVALCKPRETDARVVEGVITDEYTGVLLPGARVLATTYPQGKPQSARTREIVSDRDARYRICDIPLDHALTLQAHTAERRTAERTLPLEAMIVRNDIRIRVAGPGDVVGRIVDRDTGRPVPAADIAFRGANVRTQADELGFFVLSGVLPGDHVIEVAHLGFEPVERPISVLADRTVDVRVELSADPIELEPLVVTAVRDRRLEVRGFYDRKMTSERRGTGFFLDPTAIEARPTASTSSLLREAPGVRVTCRGRSCDVGSTRGCRTLDVYLNGTLAVSSSRGGDMTIDELVRPSELAAVEVYAAAGDAPGEYTGLSGNCGSVVLWTR